MVTIQVPDDLKIKTISETVLPKNWKEFPHPPSTQKFGDDFVLENKYCILKVPSVVTKGDFNLLINPNHKDFSKIKITEVVKFPFDKRIFK
jgi:RES domain-containing protein